LTEPPTDFFLRYTNKPPFRLLIIDAEKKVFFVWNIKKTQVGEFQALLLNEDKEQAKKLEE